MKTLKIYTDGSCLKNPGGAGGYCAIITDGKKKTVIKGGEKGTTSNRVNYPPPIEVEALNEP